VQRDGQTSRGPARPALIHSVAIAAASVFAALVGTLILHGSKPDRHESFSLFFAAVALSAGVGGLWAGLAATLLSVLTCDYFFLPPYHSFVVAAGDLPILILFAVAALLINAVSGRLWAQTRHADQRYYSLVQGLDGIVWEMNPRTLQFTFVNRRAELLLGYPVAEWLAEPDFRARITHPDDLPRMRGLWSEALAAGGEHTADYRTLTLDRREVWIRETIFVGHDGHGRPNRISGLAIDITERMAEARELTAARDELAILNKISGALSASLEMPVFLENLRFQLRQHLGVEAGRLYLADERGDEMRQIDAWSASGDRGGELELPGDRHWVSTIEVPLLAEEDVRGSLRLYACEPLRIAESRQGFYGALGRQIGALLQNVTLYREVREARERLRQLSRQLVSVQEAERRAIARELHDEIGQVLTGLKLALEMSPRMDRESQGEHLRRALVHVQDLIARVESLSLDLRPPMLDDLGLVPALQWHCARYTALTGVHVHLEHVGVAARLPPDVEITAYRVVQEALTNVARHACVKSVAVRLWATREILGIQVADGGCGFDPNAAGSDAGRSGLAGMKERATLLGGHLTIETAPGAGTTITVDLPRQPGSSEPGARGEIAT
jgi:PAS domain S-box-containing protein